MTAYPPAPNGPPPIRCDRGDGDGPGRGQCPTDVTDTTQSVCDGGYYSPSSVLLSSGQFSFHLPIVGLQALGGPWSLQLIYLAGSEVDGLVGKGFNYLQSLRIEALDGGDVRLLTGRNLQADFEEADTVGSTIFYRAVKAQYADQPNTAAVELVRRDVGTNDEQFEMISDRGVRCYWYGFDGSIDTPGRIKRVQDAWGSETLYSWVHQSGRDQLQKVTDAYGREVSYSYYGSAQQHRLQEVQDPQGRKVNFQYDGDGRLVGVVLPSVDKAADGNSFPGGTAYVFE